MKKILLLFGVFSLISAPASLVVACNIGSLDGSDYLNGLPNFDWTNSDYGDGINFDNTNSQNIINNIGNINDLGNVKPSNTGHYLNYSKFNTGFQWTQNIKKQAVTGVPLNKGFMPNGNYASDFGITSSARKYLRMNSILDWNPQKDYDAKYNRATVPLQKRQFVATYNSSNQDENINYNQLGFSTRKHRTFDNTIVGTKNPFENTPLNWQYTNYFINWSGSWFEGPIVPPPADVIDSAHINGTPIFGNLFLDGYHGLTKEMLKDFLSKNSDGTYKIVDILINIANYNGFDGWFINNEPNGAAPNGTVLDYNVMAEIIKEFNYKVATASDPNIQALKIIFYRNGATVSKGVSGYNDIETLKMADSGYRKTNGEVTPTDIQLTFGETPDKTTSFLTDYPNYSGKNLNTILDAGANAQFFGSYDFRQLGYAETMIAGKPQYNKNVYTGISDFLDNGAGTFGSYAYNWAKNHNVNGTRAYLFATQTTNLFNNIQFSGTNTFIRNNNIGMQANNNANDYQGWNASDNYQEAAFISDPRIKTAVTKGKPNPFVKDTIYNYLTNNGYNSSSYGIGDLVKERTTLFDDNQILNKKTNFSMGSGIKFVNHDQNGNSIVANDYPWTNRRLTDILPTYQWKIYDDAHPEQPLDISKISGFYDYDQLYEKGNSIAIGSGFNEEGSIINGDWNTSKVYDWDIMGTNLIKNDHQISFIYNTNGDNNAKVNFLVTTTDQKSLIANRQTFSPNNEEELQGGWVKITLDLKKIGGINTFNRISKLGLQIKATNNNFKFNVGEFEINSPTTNNQIKENTVISNPKSEYVINRTVNNQILYNARFQWDAVNIENLSYYAIYYFDEKKWYRVGETNQNYYFLKNLKSIHNQLKLMIKPVYNNNVIAQQSFVFNIEI
ncbi:endo-beta-N-acetylglucosaminidase [Spiroplasma endosymbiont of Phycita roborella]|uniref:endo-beta-N-acetylglucosaminidase n=3 Tax=unclassified Spiroplasma TaxID=2637901 RepID=UPI00313AC336